MEAFSTRSRISDSYSSPTKPATGSAVKPERNLLAAILGRAILDLYGEAATSQITIRSARAWLFSPIDFSTAFSFGWVAQQLNLDPMAIRTHLQTFGEDKEILLKSLTFLR